MVEKRIEGLWDCAYCGRKAIKARSDACTSCGKPRGIETVFYLPEDLDGAALTQEEKARTTNAPDWLCAYCGSYNRSDASCCTKCGGDRAESKADYGILHKLTGRSLVRGRGWVGKGKWRYRSWQIYMIVLCLLTIQEP